MGRAGWCLKCGELPDVCISIERNGVMGHYGACWQHIVDVAQRVMRDHAPVAELHRPHEGAIDTTARDADLRQGLEPRRVSAGATESGRGE